LTKWFRDNFGEAEKLIQDRTGVNAYSLLSSQAEHIPPGSEGLIALPYFSGERAPIYDSSAKGMIFGLNVYHSRSHVYRALLEGTAYSFRHVFESFEEHDVQISEVIACGGGAKNPLWVKIVSDVIGYDQTIPNMAMGSDIGCAYLAAIGIGLIEDIASFLQERRHQHADIVKVDQENHTRYGEYYRIYRSLYEHTKTDMWALSKLMDPRVTQ
jgi:xylulokinase